MTNLFLSNDEGLMDVLKGILLNQTLTFVNSIAVTNPVTKFQNNAYMHMSTILEHVKRLKKYAILINGVSIDISCQFQYVCSNYMKQETRMEIWKKVCENLKEAMLQHVVFDWNTDLENDFLNLEVQELIQVYNDEIQNSERSKSAKMRYL